MLTIQSTSLALIEKRIRHPDILKYKINFIQQHKDLFEFLFVTDWRAYDCWGRHHMKGRMPPKKTDWSVAAIEMGNVLKQMFNYNSMSDPKSIMYHFRRLYFKIYEPNEAILNYLKPIGRTIDPMKALRLFDCWSLSSIISDLNKPRRIIKSELVTDKKTKKVYAKYSLI